MLQNKQPYYSTQKGDMYLGDSRDLLEELPDESIDLCITSPPFALQNKKEYGNESPESYNDWFFEFADRVYDILKEDGSFVIEIGGGWQKGKPIRSLYHFKLLIKLVEEGDFNLAQDFYWYNPAKLPTPAQWVNIERIRVKDAVTHVWWLSKSERPEADNTRVLGDYSKSMEDLIETGSYNEGKRPSGHDISNKFDEPEEDGPIPPNLLKIANTASRTHYLDACRDLDIDAHPARFPRDLPKFFINFLTEEEDTVLDIFAGSNMTGEVAERMNRQWLSFENEEKYVKNSLLRFLDNRIIEEESDLDKAIEAGLESQKISQENNHWH